MTQHAHDDADEELERALFARRAGVVVRDRIDAPPPFAQVLAAIDEEPCAERRVRTVTRAAAAVIAVAACAAALFMGIRPRSSGEPSIVAEPEMSMSPIDLVGGYSGEAPRENTCAPSRSALAACASLTTPPPSTAVCESP